MAEVEEANEGGQEATFTDVEAVAGTPVPDAGDIVSLDAFMPKVLDLGDAEDPVSVEQAYEAVFGYKPSDSPEALSKELFKSNLLSATNTICQLAAFGTNERIRFDAAKYIHESFNGKPGANPGGVAGAWDDFFKEVGMKPPAMPDELKGK